MRGCSQKSLSYTFLAGDFLTRIVSLVVFFFCFLPDCRFFRVRGGEPSWLFAVDKIIYISANSSTIYIHVRIDAVSTAVKPYILVTLIGIGIGQGSVVVPWPERRNIQYTGIFLPCPMWRSTLQRTCLSFLGKSSSLSNAYILIDYL